MPMYHLGAPGQQLVVLQLVLLFLYYGIQLGHFTHIQRLDGDIPALGLLTWSEPMVIIGVPHPTVILVIVWHSIRGIFLLVIFQGQEQSQCGVSKNDDKTTNKLNQNNE